MIFGKILCRTLLHIYKAHPVSNGKLSGILEMVRSLSNRAGVRIPAVYITELPLPGSFIIGNEPHETVLVLPERLLDKLGNDELKAMISYNIVQINGEIRSKTLVALIAGLLTAASTAVRRGATYMGFGDYNEPAPRLIGFFISGLVVPPAAALVHSVTKKDYDAETAALCEDPGAVVSAIERLEENNVTSYPSLGFLCLVDPQYENFFDALFRIHPVKEARIKNLTNGEYP